jgi:hypothetical protein
MKDTSKDERLCPICGRSKSIGYHKYGGRKYSVEILFAECSSCRYHFNFVSLSIFLQWGWIALIPVVYFSFLYITDPPYQLVLLLPLFLLMGICFLLLIDIAQRSMFFDEYFDRTIIKKARGLVKHGNTHNLIGEKFTNPKTRRNMEMQMNLEIR